MAETRILRLTSFDRYKLKDHCRETFVHMGFLVHDAIMGQVFIRFFPCPYNSTIVRSLTYSAVVLYNGRN